MRVLTKGKDISQLVLELKWAGDTKQVARTLRFTVARNGQDPAFPSVSIQEGDEVFLLEQKKILFGGIVFEIQKKSGTNSVSYLAYDLMFYINQSDINDNYQGLPEEIVPKICEKLEIPYGKMAATGIPVTMTFLGKRAYAAIMMAYTAAARQNGKKYMPLMMENQLCVIEKGTLSGVTIAGSYNLLSASYQSSLQKLVNRVLLLDPNNNPVKTVEDAESIKRYGVVQRVLKQGENEDKTIEAEKLLKRTEQTASVSGIPSDPRAISGYSLLLRDPETGLSGQFYIESDTHSYKNGISQIDLTLSFELLMDEHNPEGE